MTFHKRATRCLLLLLTLLFATLQLTPAEARTARHHGNRHARHQAHLKAAKGRHHAHRNRHRRHSRGRRLHRHHYGRNHVRGAAAMLAAAARRPLKIGDTQVGAASWYGARYHGRTTSSGERFDKNGLTAAHLSLPFGTRVRVRNLANDSAVIVRITDRGPFGRGRVLDVSEGAAEALGFRSQGVCRVAVEVLPALAPDEVPEQQTLPCFEDTDLARLASITLTFPEPDHYYFLALNAYPELASAQMAVQQLQAQNPGLPVVVADETASGQPVHRVLVGRFTDRFEAKLLSDRLRHDGLQASVQEIDLVAN